jgi:dihydroorotate dehydrogenase (fumarate)
MKAGAQCVKLEGGVAMADTIDAITRVDIPVIAHIGLTPQSYHRMGGHRVQGRRNGYEAGGRERLLEDAHAIEQAGASALELNMYHIPTDLTETGADIEARYTEIVSAVCHAVSLPVSVKLTPYLSAIGHFATTLADHGAKGLVLFNRLLEPDIDLARLALTDDLELSDPSELRLPLLWIAILAGRAQASLALSTGVAEADDVVKALLAGADVVMTTSALLRHDLSYMRSLELGLRQWMDSREIESLATMRGMLSWERSTDRSAYTRANYLRILERYASA